MDLDGNFTKDAHSAPADTDAGWQPDRRFFGFVLPRTAKDFALEKELAQVRAQWEHNYKIKQEFDMQANQQLQPTESYK